MVEALREHDLGPDVDEEGNLLNEIANPISLDEAVWKIDKERQDQAVPYIELKQKIDELPDFERNAVQSMILEFLSKEMTAQGETYRDYGIVQYFGRSSRPLSYWERCNFNTKDGKLEEYLNNKVRPAVEEMVEDLK